MSPLRSRLQKTARDRAGDVTAELDPIGQAPSFLEELGGLKDVLASKQITEVPAALSATALAGQKAFASATDTNLPLIGGGAAVAKARKRQKVWETTFARHRIPFSAHYLSGGGDFGDPARVKDAFMAAGQPIDDRKALEISVSMTNMLDDKERAQMDGERSKSAADLSRMWKVLGQAGVRKSALGADAADALTRAQLGSVFGVAKKRFYNQASSLGITNRTPASKIEQILASLSAPTAPPAVPSAKLHQAELPFSKQATADDKTDIETASGKRKRKAHKQDANKRAIIAALLGGGAYGSYQAGNWFLPEETRNALGATADTYEKLLRSRTLSGNSDALDNRVIGSYADLGHRLTNAPIAGMTGKEFVKGVRTVLPVSNPWQRFWSDAHYDAFERGPAYGATQLIDEEAQKIGKRHSADSDLRRYITEHFTADFGSKANEIAEQTAGANLFRPEEGLREGVAFGKGQIPLGAQRDIVKQLLTDSDLNTHNRNFLGMKTVTGLGSATKEIKRQLSNGILESSLPNYLRLGGYATNIRNVLSGALPIALGVGAAGAAGMGIYSALKGVSRTAEEERRLARKKDEGDLEKGAAFEGCSEKQLRALGDHFGVGPYAKPYVPHYRECPKCHEKKARVKEVHADTGMDDFELKCDACGKWSDIEKKASLSSHLRNARNKTHTHPTPGQAAAGNYSKGEILFRGIKIKLENPKGTTRRGYDAKGVVKWERLMAEADYGYFAGTKAIDGDAIDVFIGPDLDSDLVVAVDQIKADGSFDEHKFLIGVTSQAQAEKIYLSNYPRGWKLGPVSTTTVPQLKKWLREGDTKAPFKGQMVKAAAGGVGALVRGLRKGMKWSDVVAPNALDRVADVTAPTSLWRGHDYLNPAITRSDTSMFSVANKRNAVAGNGELLHATPIPGEARSYGTGFGLTPGQRVRPGRVLDYDTKLVSRYPAGAEVSYGANGSVLSGSGGTWGSLPPNDLMMHAAYEAPLLASARPLSTGLMRGGYAGTPIQYAELSGLPEWARLQRAVLRRPSLLEKVRNAPEWNTVKSAKLHPIHWTAFGETPPTDEEIKAYYDKPRPKPVLFKGSFREFLNYTGARKQAALRPDKWERLCVRRGQCPACQKPNCEGCDCGKTLSDDEWKALREKHDTRLSSGAGNL